MGFGRSPWDVWGPENYCKRPCELRALACKVPSRCSVCRVVPGCYKRAKLKPARTGDAHPKRDVGMEFRCGQKCLDIGDPKIPIIQNWRLGGITTDRGGGVSRGETAKDRSLVWIVWFQKIASGPTVSRTRNSFEEERPPIYC
jgi:hypothetical protein